MKVFAVLLVLFSIGTLLAPVPSSTPSQATSTITTTTGYLSVNLDKTTYYPGDTVHITGGISTPSCTWTYTSAGGLAVAITIYDPNGLLVLNSTTNPSAAGYKLYAYDYPLSAGAVAGRYTIDVSYGYTCGGGRIFGQGAFQVVLGTACTNCVYSYYMDIRTDKTTYLQGETVHVFADFEMTYPTSGCPTMTSPGPPPYPSSTLGYVVWSRNAKVIYSAIANATQAGNQEYTFDFQGRYDWAPGEYSLVVLTDLSFYTASTSFQIIANPSATLTTITTLTTYTTTVPEFTSLALILGMAVIMITLFVRRINRTRMSRRSSKGETAV